MQCHLETQKKLGFFADNSQAVYTTLSLSLLLSLSLSLSLHTLIFFFFSSICVLFCSILFPSNLFSFPFILLMLSLFILLFPQIIWKVFSCFNILNLPTKLMLETIRNVYLYVNNPVLYLKLTYCFTFSFLFATENLVTTNNVFHLQSKG